MSAAISAWAFACGEDVEGKLVLLALADDADGDGRVLWRLESIGRRLSLRTGLERVRVLDAIERLERLGALAQERGCLALTIHGGSP
jgi:hypothetical protein